MSPKRLSWIGCSLLLVFSVWSFACVPTPTKQDSCAVADDCGNTALYACEWGTCVPKSASDGQSQLSESNPWQPDLTGAESVLVDSGPTEGAPIEGVTPEKTGAEHGNLEVTRPEGGPTEVVQEPPPQCLPGETIPCYTGQTGCVRDPSNGELKCTAPCELGKRTCVNGRWSDGCPGEVTPQVEDCNGKDDDCDGKIDNELPIDKAPDCTRNKGPCAGLKQTCTNGSWEDCDEKTYKNYTQGTFQYEHFSCDDGVDNDCNGKIDLEDKDNQTGCAWSRVYPPRPASADGIRWIAATEGDGAIFALGEYVGTPNLPNGPNAKPITFPTATQKTGFLVRLNAQGYIDWHVTFTPKKADSLVIPTALTFVPDASDRLKHAIFLTGKYKGSVNLSSNGPTTAYALERNTNNTSTSHYIFLLKYNAASGTYITQSKIEPINNAEIEANSILHGTYLYLAGSVRGKAKTDNSVYFSSQTSNITNAVPYVMKIHIENDRIDPSYAKTITTSSGVDDAAYGMAFDPSQKRLYVVGRVTGSSYIDGQYRQNRGEGDAFLLSLGDALSLHFFQVFGSQGNDTARAVAFSNGSIFVVGDSLKKAIQIDDFVAAPTGQSGPKIPKWGERTMFVTRWDTQGQGKWIFGAGANNQNINTGRAGLKLLKNQISPTHIDVRRGTLYVGGHFRGTFSYYKDPQNTFTNANYTPSTTRLQTLVRGFIADVFLLTLDESSGEPSKTRQKNLVTYTNDLIDMLAGFAFDHKNVDYAFLNQHPLSGGSQPTQTRDIFESFANPDPHQAFVEKPAFSR